MPDEPCEEEPLTVRPFDLDKASAAKDVNDLLNAYVTVMDTKASAFLAGNVAAATFLLHDVPGGGGGWAQVAYLVAVALFASSTIVAGGVIFPRRPASGGTSVLFWGDIAQQADLKSYVKEFNRVMETGLLDEQYCVQNWCTARVLRRKYTWLRWAILLFFLALFVAFVVYVAAPHHG